VAVEKPNVNNFQKEKQIKFAQEHLNWTIADWKQVIWLDESLFKIGKNSQVVRVWRTKEQKYDIDCLEPTFKSGRTSTMVWGAFFGKTKAPLVSIPLNSRKDADFIEEVYKPGLVPFLQEHNPNHSRRLVLMEDGAPVHKAKLLAAFLAKSKIDKIPDWPPQSHQKCLGGPEDQHPRALPSKVSQ
jgi:hypothetical protein